MAKNRPAFPTHSGWIGCGVSIHERYARAAMQGLIANAKLTGRVMETEDWAALAADAFHCADAMMLASGQPYDEPEPPT